jgi:hypothetical protein
MRDDFCIFILTHGRPDRVLTYDTLIRAGYTGPIFIVIDDEDKTADRYREKFGDKVIQFSKADVAKTFDEGDNFNDRRAIIYARNACFDIAERLGFTYFMQCDDDYTALFYRVDAMLEYASIPIRKSFDYLAAALIDFFEGCPALRTVAIAQGGDFIGGAGNVATVGTRRKAMNSFICSTKRRFQFFGRINEDVNTYCTDGRRGALFLTVMAAQLVQMQTQQNAGGMTDLYLDSGTYVKTFYSVMYCPSGVKVAEMGDHRSPHYRIHHAPNWHRIAPKILRESHRKSAGG